MEKPKLYRRRFIPDEIVFLKDDMIEHMDERIIVTSWKAIRPRSDFESGCSCYFLNEGYKVSRFFDKDGKLIHTYCDIISVEYDEAANEYIFNDLLIDVLILNDGTVKVLDLDELSEALDRGFITVELAKTALSTTDRLLSIIYSGGLDELTERLKS